MLGHTLAGRYRLEERIADGGMGAVWRAYDEVLERPVAVKLLHSTLSGDTRAAERFRREALTAASVSHPNMANVFDYVEEDGHPGIVMELIEGETVADLLAREGRLAPDRAIAIMGDVLAALAAAHAIGIVHRDIKPANILLTPNGMVKVADFGIAQVADSATLTMTGSVVGSVRYISPEQVRGDTATAAADLYAAAAVLYEMLTGRAPFTGDSSTSIALARLNEDPVPIDALLPSLPSWTAAAIMRGLAREPGARHANAGAMRDALLQRTPSIDATQVFGADDETIAFAPMSADVEPARAPGLGEGARRLLRLIAVPLIVIALIAVAFAWLVAEPSTVTVPDLTGRSIAAARRVAADTGFTVRITMETSSKPKGTIIEQTPAAGRTIDRGARVTLVASSGPPPCCRMPDVVGLSEKDARSRLDDAGLTNIRTIRVFTTKGDPDQVIAQGPSRGERLDPSDEATITVTAEPPKGDDEDKPGKGRDRD